MKKSRSFYMAEIIAFGKSTNHDETRGNNWYLRKCRRFEYVASLILCKKLSRPELRLASKFWDARSDALDQFYRHSGRMFVPFAEYDFGKN